ncbi:MAG: hypothetical protein E6K70_12605 [Planctomycetota bacterium]|nr:MAG: hypothetical protein E6K70_12605 [Planctomycetota bacterium]
MVVFLLEIEKIDHRLHTQISLTHLLRAAHLGCLLEANAKQCPARLGIAQGKGCIAQDERAVVVERLVLLPGHLGGHGQELFGAGWILHQRLDFPLDRVVARYVVERQGLLA